MKQESVRISAEMFLYLNSCPDPITPWIHFYHNLIHNSSPARIILGVNRMLKTLHKSHNKELYDIATQFLKEAIDKFQLHHLDIECLTSGKKCVLKEKVILGRYSKSFLGQFTSYIFKERRSAEVISNHPVHLMNENGNKSQSAFIPFCTFGGDLAVMAKKIDNFDVPVCNSFRAKILQNQLCYEVDLNKYKNISNIENQLSKGLTFLYDTNKDKENLEKYNQ